MKKGMKILYRGEKYKVIDTKIVNFGSTEIEYVKIPHKAYDIWVNAAYADEI